MQIELIAAVDMRWGMGLDGGMPWHLPEDFKHFKRATMGHIMVMGRGTFESMGKRVLPGRTSVVVTSQADYDAPAARLAQSPAEAIEFARGQGESRCMIIGGASIYRACLPLCDVLHLTLVHAEVDADTFFPALNPRAFVCTERTRHEPDARHAHAFDVLRLERDRAHPVFHSPQALCALPVT